MSELMKKQTTKDFAEIRFYVPADKEAKVKEIIENLLTLGWQMYAIPSGPKMMLFS